MSEEPARHEHHPDLCGVDHFSGSGCGVEPKPFALAVGRWTHYMSTACQHALSESDEQLAERFHVRCRKTCKFCDAGCRCYCHVPDVSR